MPVGGRAGGVGLVQRQRERLAGLLTAAQCSPLLRERLDDVAGAVRALQDPRSFGNASPERVSEGVLQTLRQFPVSRKAELMARFDDWVTDPAVTLADLRGFVADPSRVGEPYRGRYAVWESSGSRGEPALFVQDPAALAVYDALEAWRRAPPRPWQRWLDPFQVTERWAFVGAIEGHFASEVSMVRLRRANPWAASRLRSFSILQPTASLVAAPAGLFLAAPPPGVAAHRAGDIATPVSIMNGARMKMTNV